MKANPSTSELVGQATDQFSELVREEMRLAQIELADKGKKAAFGLGLLGGSGAFAFFGLASLITAAILGLANVVAPWLSALIVGAVLLALAGAAALKGAKQTKQAVPPIPTQATQSVKADINAIKEGASR